MAQLRQQIEGLGQSASEVATLQAELHEHTDRCCEG